VNKLDKRKLEAFLCGASIMAGARYHYEGTWFPSTWDDHWESQVEEWAPDCQPAFRAGGNAGHASMSIAEAFSSAMEYMRQQADDSLLARFLAAINDRREAFGRALNSPAGEWILKNPITPSSPIRGLRNDDIWWGLSHL